MARKGTKKCVMSRKGRQTRPVNRRTKKSTMTGGRWPFSKKPSKELPAETHEMVINPLAIKSSSANLGSVPASAFGPVSKHQIITVGSGFKPPSYVLRPRSNTMENEANPSGPVKASKAKQEPQNPFKSIAGFNTKAMEKLFANQVKQQENEFTRMRNGNNPQTKSNPNTAFSSFNSPKTLKAPFETSF